MANFDSSKAQNRLAALFGLEHDGTYDMASRLLDAAGLPSDGIPSGHTWRTAGKLSDDELKALCPTAKTVTVAVATGRDAELARRAESLRIRENVRQHYNDLATREPRNSDEGREWFEPMFHSAENDSIDG